MAKLVVIDHPLVQHKLTLLRDKNTGTNQFRTLVQELAMLLAYEATRDLTLEDTTVETPITTAKTKVLSGKKLGIVPILRAGLGMVDGMMSLIPAAKVGHIGLYRDPETLSPVDYYCNHTHINLCACSDKQVATLLRIIHTINNAWSSFKRYKRTINFAVDFSFIRLITHMNTTHNALTTGIC